MSYTHYEAVLDRAIDLGAGQPVKESDIARFDRLVPEGLKEVWRRHGNHVVFNEARVQLCDPLALQTVLAAWFVGDPEFQIEKLVPFAFSSEGTILLIHDSRQLMSLDTAFSRLQIDRIDLQPPAETDVDLCLSDALKAWCDPAVAWEGDDPHADAVAKNGAPAVGEMFSWEPPFQTGELLNCKQHKYNALERIAYLRDLAPLELHRVFKDVFEAVPYGGETFVRAIGHQTNKQ